MSDDEIYAAQQALARKIDELSVKLESAIKAYFISITSTGHNPPVPPRPALDLLVRVSDSAQLLNLTLKVPFASPNN